METIKNIEKNTIEQESYDIENSYIDPEKKSIHVPIKFANVGGMSYFDVDTINYLGTRISEKYPNFNFTPRRDIDEIKNECVFFYE